MDSASTKSEPLTRGSERSNVVGMHERRLGDTVFYTRRDTLDVDDILPNPKQPRIGSKVDIELQRQIDANNGIFEPLIVEPHPELAGKFRLIDGERRWTNAKELIKAGKEQYRRVPVEITNRTLTDEERLRSWIYIHRQRKEWDAKEKEMVAYRLVDLVGPASAANILGINIRELDKLVHVYELSQRFTNLQEPSAAITWARELNGLSKNLVNPEVVDAIVDKVGGKRITNSKDLRKLRTILRDPVAKAHFLSREGDIESALLRVAAADHKTSGLTAELESAITTMKKLPWTAIADLKGNQKLLDTIEDAEALLSSLKRTLST
jgi:ParB family transcriptional regulator, chromosome partitioning protein